MVGVFDVWFLLSILASLLWRLLGVHFAACLHVGCVCSVQMVGWNDLQMCLIKTVGVRS